MIEKLINKYKSVNVQVKASFWFLLCGFFQKGMAVITTPIFTRLMSTEDYGVYGAFVSWQTIIGAIITLNLYSGIFLQGIVKSKKKKIEYTSIMMCLCTTLVVIWTIIYWMLRLHINNLISLNTSQVLLMIILIWSTAIFSFWSSEQRVENKYKLLVVVTLVVSLLQPTLGIIFVKLMTDTVTARILGMVLVAVAAYIPIFIITVIRSRTVFSFEIWKHMFLIAVPLLPHYLSTNILNCADRIMIREMIGPSEAGLYSLAYSLSLLMTFFNQALLQTIEPWLYKKIKDGQIERMGKVAFPSFFAVATVNILLILLAPEAVKLFAPEEYADAIWVIPPVAMSVFFMFLYTFFAVFEFYYEKSNYIAFATIIGAVTNIVLNYLCIRRFGYYAAGYTTLICYIIFALLHYCFMKKLCKEHHSNNSPYRGDYIVILSLVFVVIGFLIMFSYRYTFIRLVLVSLIIILLIIFRKQEIKLVRSLLSAKKGE